MTFDLLCVALALLAPTSDSTDVAAPGGDAPTSRITDVVVFPNHAEVTRQIAIDAVAGGNRVVFGGLVPILNPSTLRASVSEGCRITGTELRTIHLTESLSAEIEQLESAIREHADARDREQQALARRDEEAAFYRAVKDRLSADMTRELTAGTVSVTDWKQVLGFVGDGLGACDEDRAAIGLRIRALDETLAALRAELDDYADRKPKQMKEATVAFVCDRPGPTRVQVHYMVDATSWKPSYDVQLDRARQDVTITGYGQVTQWTGETWDDVRLTLAMSRPDSELSLPALAPMVASLDDAEMAKLAEEVAFLNALAGDQARKWSEERFKRRQERETFRRNLEQLQRYSATSLKAFGLSRELVEGALSRLVDRFAAVRYEIEGRESIPYDSSTHKVVTFSATVPVELQYVATPALGDSVMLLGSLTNTAGHPILEGMASLFVDRSYVGVSQVAGAAQNERVSLGFGPDDALAVTRRLVTRDVKGPEAFRLSQVITYHYEITIENFNDRAVEVQVADQIPVSKTPDIQVAYLGSTVEAGVEEASGILRWPLELEAGGKLVIKYGFSVECPVDEQVHWK